MESAKLRALLYADIFDYPLSKSEIERWKIKGHEAGIRNYESGIRTTNGYYYLKGRKNLVALRKKREKISRLKLEIARNAVNLLKTIPTIKMVAITGALAHLNCKKTDDIDLLIIAKKDTLWLTRFLATFILELKGIRRRPKAKTAQDKICLNMFLEDAYLTLPKAEQDLYGAHEVCQIKPIFERDNAYSRFLRANNWARKFLPNGLQRGTMQNSTQNHAESIFSVFLRFVLRFSAEPFAKALQLWYMNTRRSNEVITDHMLRFHPKDYRIKVITEYEKRV